MRWIVWVAVGALACQGDETSPTTAGGRTPTGPLLLESQPEAAAVDVPVVAHILLRFDGEVDADPVEVVLRMRGESAPVPSFLTGAGSEVRVTPIEPLPYGGVFTLTLAGAPALCPIQPIDCSRRTSVPIL